jgi:hypothetical protein
MYLHKLVSLGDSLVQGFQHGAIYRTAHSFPAILAKALHPCIRFDQAQFEAGGGLPLNMEMLIRSLEPVVGPTMEPEEWRTAVLHVLKTVRAVRNHWNGKAGDSGKAHYTPYHNQAVWGAGVSDAWVLSDAACAAEIARKKQTLSILGFLPDHAQYVTARHVLNPSLEPAWNQHTMLDNVAWFADNGGIENLVVWLGSNNVVGAVTSLRFAWTAPGDAGRMPGRRRGTVTPPEVFHREFSRLAARLAALRIRNVFIATVPYVTLPPLLASPCGETGIAKWNAENLTHPWLMRDGEMLPGVPFLTQAEVRLLNDTVDAYNRSISEICALYGFVTVPLNRMIYRLPASELVSDPTVAFPTGLQEALASFPATAHLAGKGGGLTAAYPEAGATGKLTAGGLFSLDGLHPSQTGYALIAYVFMLVMKKHGVAFQNGIDWKNTVASDSLLQSPPKLLGELQTVMQLLTAGLWPMLKHSGTRQARKFLDALTASRNAGHQ